MKPDQYFEAFREPKNWFDRAEAMRVAYFAVWRKAHLENEIALAKTERDPTRLSSYLHSSAEMLRGLSLELALKGRILKFHPKKIGLKIEADGTGATTSIHLKMTGDHNLEVLADQAGLLSHGGDKDLRIALRELSEYITWRGRYPVPKETAPEINDTVMNDPLAEDVLTPFINHVFEENRKT